MFTGGRDWKPSPADAWALRAILRLCDVTVLHHGDCAGADLWAGKVCSRLGIGVEVHPYAKGHGKAGGPMRNRAMAKAVREAGGTVCIAAPGGTGTADATRAAAAEGLSLVLLAVTGLELEH